MNKHALKEILKACAPVMLGYFPTGSAFGFMMAAVGYPIWVAVLMAACMYAGAGQYMAVQFFLTQASFWQIGLVTFLINSKHLFYGLSLLNDYKGTGFKKPYMIFTLTDETYALLTEPGAKSEVPRPQYCFYVSMFNHWAWIASCFFGAALGSLIEIDIRGMEFAMTALFLVIVIEQLKAYKTKIPFVLGIVCTLASVFIVGKANMLLLGAALSVVFMIVLRKRVEAHDYR